MLARGTERRDLLETVQGYVILKAATFETGHGFALGHNPGAPSPFVTWQFTEGENGHRDYYWGRYGTSQAWAQRDFDRRVDDYQQLYHTAVKHTELEPEGVYRYYSTQRPVDIGTYPKPPDNQPLSIVNYDDDRRRPVADGRLMAWGELTYAKPLTEKQMEDYELKPAPGNPDRVRPSITARLKEGTRGQEPPKEPGQKRNHKTMRNDKGGSPCTKRQLSENRRALHGAELQHDRRRTQQHAHPTHAPGAGRKTA